MISPKNAQGVGTGSQTLYIPYVGIAAIVTVLAAIFFFAKVPDIKSRGQLSPWTTRQRRAMGDREVKRGPVYFLLLFNAAVLVCISV